MNFIKKLLNFLFLKKVCSSFKDNVWGADFADMQLVSMFDTRIRFLLCVFYIFGKYAWVIHLKDKISITTINAFQKVLSHVNQAVSRIKYGLTKAANFTTIQ